MARSPIVGARELKTRLGTYLNRVRRGETILVTDRSEPIAELRPVHVESNPSVAALRKLAAAGVVTLPTRARLAPFAAIRSRGASASEAIVRERMEAAVSASLATGAAVSLGGPVGFVGIVVPHLVRLMVGADHRVVLPAAALFGAAFLVLCDLLARTLMAPLEIPVGVITALIGGPFFLWLLVRQS